MENEWVTRGTKALKKIGELRKEQLKCAVGNLELQIKTIHEDRKQKRTERREKRRAWEKLSDHEKKMMIALTGKRKAILKLLDEINFIEKPFVESASKLVEDIPIDQKLAPSGTLFLKCLQNPALTLNDISGLIADKCQRFDEDELHLVFLTIMPFFPRITRDCWCSKPKIFRKGSLKPKFCKWVLSKGDSAKLFMAFTPLFPNKYFTKIMEDEKLMNSPQFVNHVFQWKWTAIQLLKERVIPWRETYSSFKDWNERQKENEA